eukprot:TRINITY_DN1973_c0_g1_i3.p1 TRINITY_DN1973_c0_g1~~TRINITY_DN1973_c0_g1_i3.p1  ORF type:complete len:856 (-),score=194.27 TRINITY_DN1973_c0_g1_i3:215-2782(-)
MALRVVTVLSALLVSASATDTVLCADNCNGHGACNSGICECGDGWFGQSCAEKLDASADCDPPCAASGSCVNGACKCNAGFAGIDCSKTTVALAKATSSATASLRATTAAATTAASNKVAPAASANAAAARSAVNASAKAAAKKPEGESLAVKAAHDAVLAASQAVDGLLSMTGLKGSNVVIAQPKVETLSANSTQAPALVQKNAPAPAAAPNDCDPGCSGPTGMCENGVCKCKEGWTGSICDMPRCESDCNGRGLCVKGRCICQDGYYGDACYHQRCLNDCSGAGYCFQGKCQCISGFGGEDCSQVRTEHQTLVVKLKSAPAGEARPGIDRFRETGSLRSAVSATCPSDCNNRGDCTKTGKCRCHAGYSGVACESFCPNECSGSGRCIEGGCLCFAGFTGVDCSIPGCCSGHGSCDVPGTCDCHPGWGGAECAVKLECQDPDCSGKGACRNGVCECVEGFTGPTCAASTSTCIPECGSHGTCSLSSHTCECATGWTGDDCKTQIKECPNHCNTRGLCLNGKCLCGAGWSGLDCSRRYFAPGGEAQSMLSDKQPDVGFMIGADGMRADESLVKELGDEPRIGLDYKPVPPPPPPMTVQSMLPGLPPNAGLMPGIPKIGLAAASNQPQKTLSLMAQKEADAVNRLVMDPATEGKICGEGGLCSGHGACNTEKGLCECEGAFTGSVCEEQRCAGFLETGMDCHGHGVCQSGLCLCEQGWGSPDSRAGVVSLMSCSHKVCALGCGTNGRCDNGQCMCQKGWQGQTCEDPQCDDNCSGHGQCTAPSPAYPGRCVCQNGWTGTNCGTGIALTQMSESYSHQQGHKHHHSHKEVSTMAIPQENGKGHHHKHHEVSSVRLVG